MNAIVTTTINHPTAALRRFAAMPGWRLYVVGDKRTPEGVYEDMPGVTYLSPHYQESKYPRLSESIGWHCIQRRNIGFVEAWRDNAQIIASVDDDNIPYDGWGQNLLVGQDVFVTCYDNPRLPYFDPLSVTNVNHLWHRGFPIQHLQTRLQVSERGKVKMRVYVQADLWDGDPDCDAMARLTYSPNVRISGPFPFTTSNLTVFNSQNTFLHRDCFPNYACTAHTDRMDDIWGGILLQQALRRRGEPLSIVFNTPSVYQARNPHDIVGDMQREIMGHRSTLDVLEIGASALSDESNRFYAAYNEAFLRSYNA